jgi:hypothetical protein
MNKTLPDKWVRKAVYDSINNIIVDSIAIPCFDTHVSYDAQKDEPSHYVLMTTQTNDVDKRNKCEWFYESSILLDIITSFSGAGNNGSRLLVDNITDACRNALQDLTLDPSSGLVITTETMNFPADITTDVGAEVIFRKFIRLELRIK